MLPKKLQELINTLPEETQTVVNVIVLYYESRTVQLEARIKELEDQNSKNSQNSSKPPSSDGYQKPAPKSLRKKTKRRVGGQKGHKGHNLKMVVHPDHIETHRVLRCESCSEDLSGQATSSVEKRQVYDHPVLKLEVTEHASEVKVCSCCGHRNKAGFPAHVSHYVQYGPNIKAFVTYLQNYQMLPYERTAELVEDLFDHRISTGTLHNIRAQAHQLLEGFEQSLKFQLRKAPVAGFDETGVRVADQLMWLHSCSTPHHAYFEVHSKRGRKAMNAIGILPHFEGIAVHDFWKSYYKFDTPHSLCNAHLLRELIFINERFDQPWAEQLIELLVKMKAAKDKALAKGKSALSSASLSRYRLKYEAIVEKAVRSNPYPNAPPKKKRGRIKKTKPRNLAERLWDFQEDIIRFLMDFQVPFDNNASERDIRMMKVKQKISGCFRSLAGAQYFARMRSFILTARKQSIKVYTAIKDLFVFGNLQNQLASNLYC